MNSLRTVLSLLGLVCLWAAGGTLAAVEPPRRVLFVVGPSGHPPGTHEVTASARLLKYCVDEAGGGAGIETMISEGWPTDPAVVERARVIVFTGDMFPPYRFAQSKEVFAQLIRLTERGGSIVCIHYATSVNDSASTPVPPEVRANLFRLLGGFGHFLPGNVLPGTQARVLDLTVWPVDSPHPVVRGVEPFSMNDEPYFPIRFDAAKSGSPVTILATAQLPPEQPQTEVVAWGMDRGNGSRSFAVLFPHYFANWKNDSLRKLVLNGILWSAGEEVPESGFDVGLPPLQTFAPAAETPRRSKPSQE